MFSGYDVLRFVRDRFDCLLSSGTVYCTLYSMERRHLLEVVFEKRKRIYRISENGKIMLGIITQSEVCSLIHSIFQPENSKT
jgi:DNA-binding PadR family transcriptional regulator